MIALYLIGYFVVGFAVAVGASVWLGERQEKAAEDDDSVTPVLVMFWPFFAVVGAGAAVWIGLDMLVEGTARAIRLKFLAERPDDLPNKEKVDGTAP